MSKDPFSQMNIVLIEMLLKVILSFKVDELEAIKIDVDRGLETVSDDSNLILASDTAALYKGLVTDLQLLIPKVRRWEESCKTYQQRIGNNGRGKSDS